MDEEQRVDPRTGEPLAPATPAATIIIFRERDHGLPPQLLMVERAASMVFAAGAAVYPGGRVDPDDHALAATLDSPLDTDELAARVAAIRETVEETGLGVGFVAPPPSEALAEARALLHQGTAFSSICRDAGWHLDPDQLVPFARWRPPFNERRIFDTRFYLARDGGHDHVVEVDRTENRKLFWASAAEVLERSDAGSVKLIFPTLCTLHRLAAYSSFDEAREHAARHPVRMIIPEIRERDGQKMLTIPDDLGFPLTGVPIDVAMRG